MAPVGGSVGDAEDRGADGWSACEDPWGVRAASRLNTGGAASVKGLPVLHPASSSSSVVWIRESREEFFFGAKAPVRTVARPLRLATARPRCRPLRPRPSPEVVCLVCRWFDMDETGCHGDCGHVDADVPAAACLDGSFLAEDAGAWIVRDRLVHRQRYAAACSPPPDFAVRSGGGVNADGSTTAAGAAPAATARGADAAGDAGGAVGATDAPVDAWLAVLLGPLFTCLLWCLARGCRRAGSLPSASGYTAVPTDADVDPQTPLHAGGFRKATAGQARQAFAAAGARGAPWPPERERAASASASDSSASPPRQGSGDSPEHRVRARSRSDDSALSLASSDQDDAEAIIRALDLDLLSAVDAPQEERKQLLRRHQMRWHPDKNVAERRHVATAVTQHLNSKRDWFLGPSPSAETAVLLS
eukprot:TRINITY_DN16626_c0_g1_i1.p1 TRINITY_DN16626_c0_g1~~TRINITY_DN16626_c0_g1_i1.p1  ORF type:complete len:418 (+),score=82.00 TRINITY_DN16626_c0_g1_i1:88-1341(+)